MSCSRRGPTPSCALKYYRRGISPKARITEMLAGLDEEHVVEVYETGIKDGRPFRASARRRDRLQQLRPSLPPQSPSDQQVAE